MRRSALALAAAITLLTAGCSGPSTPPSQITEATTPMPIPTPTDAPTSDDLSTVMTPDPPEETPTAAPTRVLGTSDMTCDGTICKKKVSMGTRVGPLGPEKQLFTVTGIKKAKVTFLIKYKNGKRATLDLSPGDYAPFGDYDISIESVTSGTAVAVVKPPSN
jgi:hypothetical protein